MKVLIMSDSHGLTEEMALIIDRHKNETSAVIHCGDSELQADDQAVHSMWIVGGNCDFDTRYPDELVQEAGQYRFLIAHGHLHSVKSTLMNLKYKAQETGASIVCFGHTHIAGSEMNDRILFINPGSIRLPRVRPERSYAIITLEDQQAHVLFYDFSGNPIKELEKSYSFA
ncbi:metallophosphoesterase [Bacillus sp. FJAT-42376]|uniref:metallophosphoesterase family protein n=1 Tax=Bacillus sp. FJAT-42376 TaxID=2014076 RepID=UPI000F504E81|nr:metallophosphoesterase [Bacillus sp. FJAT-42376]AZB43846.1 metallophosphoesterase [Bacillus sp. FJAT-42376]